MTNVDRNTPLQKATALYQSGRLAEAEELGLAALKNDKNSIPALQLLAAIATRRGLFEIAENRLRQCVKIRPTDAGLMTSLADVQAAMGKHEPAAEHYQRAIALSETPTAGAAIAGWADMMNRLGQSDHALEFSSSHLKQRPDDPDVALICSTILQQKGRFADAIETARRPWEKNAAPAHVLRNLGFLVGACQERLGDYDAAFAAYSAAHQFDERTRRFDITEYARSVDELIGFFRPAQIRLLSRASLKTSPAVFIAGMARSGTTLIEQIIHAHPNAGGAGEFALLDSIVGTMTARLESSFTYPRCLADLSISAADAMASQYSESLRATSPDARRIVDKNLRNIEHIGLISLLFPDAPIFHCRRDPMDVCLSCYFSPLSPVNHPYTSSLRDIGLFHRQYARLMQHWQHVLEIPMLSVHYEELVADQERISRSIISYCGLDWNDQCLRYYEKNRAVRTLSYDQVRRPIYDHSIGRWRHFEKHLPPLRVALDGG